MKITVKDITNPHILISHAILNGIDGNDEILNHISQKTKQYADDGGSVMDNAKLAEKYFNEQEFDVTLTLDGFELNPMKFFELFHEQMDVMIAKSAKRQAEEMFAEYKHKYDSQNSTNAKIDKIKKQFDKCNEMMNGIKTSIENLERK